MKPLLFYMNASNYAQILEDLHNIPCDKFIVNYTPYPHPHNLARDFFLAHPQYTHLIVQPQDLHVKKEHYEKLIETVEKTGHDVVSCVCNVEREGHPHHNMWAICKKIPSKDKQRRKYNWVPATDEKLGLMEVEFQGMVFTCISRRVIERKMIDGEWAFKGTVHVGNDRFLAAPDLTFAHCCRELAIKQYADTDIRLVHYANHKPSLVNKNLSSTEYIQCHG